MAYINGKEILFSPQIRRTGTGTLEIVENGTYDMEGYAEAKVAIPLPVEVDNVEITPDFTNGDQTINVDEGVLIKSATIKQPENLKPENIAENVNIAGVVGTFKGAAVEIEGLEIELDFTNGNQSLTAEDGYVVKSAIIKKPATLTPENIAKDIEIAGIVGTHEGGSADDDRVKYVTFMYNGAELITYPVINGDTCRDPVNKGYIDKPTKEATESIVYTWGGWSLTEGGEVDETALTNVIGNRTVYAAFTETARTYTVNFYDGETLLATEQVAYGGSSSYTYTKENYVFNGWTPEPTNVTSDMDCYGQFDEKITFATGSWAKISEICESGKAEDYFTLGDTRDITFKNGTTSVTATFRIVAFNHDDKADGSGKAGITLAQISNLQTFGVKNSTQKTYNDITGYYAGGWSLCDKRTYLNGTVLSTFPTDLQSVIKEVTKISNGYLDGTNDGTFTTNDKLFDPSLREIGCTKTSVYYNQRYYTPESGESYEGWPNETNNPYYLMGSDMTIELRTGVKNHKDYAVYWLPYYFHNASNYPYRHMGVSGDWKHTVLCFCI